MSRCLILVLCLSLPSLALSQPRASTLTPQEVQDGWLLLFDGESTFGWKANGPTRAENGVVILGGDRAVQMHYATFFNEFQSALEVQVEGKSSASIQLVEDDGEMMELDLEPNRPGTWTTVTARAWSVPEAKRFGVSFSRYHPDKIDLSHGVFRKLPGNFTLALTIQAGTTVRIKNAKILPAGLTSLFNGKDLQGWKVHPNKKSKFTVTPEGWLNIKDGPGDLQTEGKWSDFVFQCQCISNGEHLNSGVFFRSRPGEYQQGYEAQIRNQFTAKPTQEYTVEDYDAKTGDLVKKKVLSTAVDFGTGAIYRRVPARKGVAKDNEWFTLTVVARNRHLATWVNGIQVADWDDHRADADNGRNGCFRGAGAISLQGHDPTTNLSFRNLRVGALPKN